jgi:hypothetical protein
MTVILWDEYDVSCQLQLVSIPLKRTALIATIFLGVQWKIQNDEHRTMQTGKAEGTVIDTDTTNACI